MQMIGILALGLVALVALVAVGGGLLGGSVTSEVIFYEQPRATSDGVVYLLREEPRRRIVGFEFGKRHLIGVSFLVDGACAVQNAENDRWPIATPECESQVDVTGDIELVGHESDGSALVGVVFEVSRECFESVAVADAWPDVATLCATDGATD